MTTGRNGGDHEGEVRSRVARRLFVRTVVTLGVGMPRRVRASGGENG